MVSYIIGYGKKRQKTLRFVEIQREQSYGVQQSDFSDTIGFGHILHWLEDVLRWNEVDGQDGTP